MEGGFLGQELNMIISFGCCCKLSSLRAFKCEKIWCYWIYDCGLVFLVNVWWLFKVFKKCPKLKDSIGIDFWNLLSFQGNLNAFKRKISSHPSSSHTLIEYWSHIFNVVILIAISRVKMREIYMDNDIRYTHVFGFKPYTTWLEKYTWGRRFDMF